MKDEQRGAAAMYIQDRRNNKAAHPQQQERAMKFFRLKNKDGEEVGPALVDPREVVAVVENTGDNISLALRCGLEIELDDLTLPEVIEQLEAKDAARFTSASDAPRATDAGGDAMPSSDAVETHDKKRGGRNPTPAQRRALGARVPARKN